MRQVYLLLTKRCNLLCDFCIRDSSINENVDLKIEHLSLVLDEVKLNFPKVQFILTGGEPTIYNNFLTVLERSLDYFEDVVVNTNGVTDIFKSDIFLRIIEKKGLTIQFSLDGNKNLHDKIRGEHTFDKVIENLRFCSTIDNVKLVVSSTVSSIEFLHGFEDLYDEILSVSSKIKWTIKRVSYSGRASLGSLNYLKNQDWNSLVEKIKYIDKRGIIEIYKTFDFEYLEDFSEEELLKYEKLVVKNCGSGTNKIYIYPNLDVLACTCYEKYPSGNLLKSKLRDILGSSYHLKIINQKVEHPVCNNCRYKRICNGGCLGSGFFTWGRFNIPDYRCPKIYEFYNS